MPRYIDADKLWDNRPQVPEGRSLDYGAGFSECMWGFSKLIRNQIDNPSGEVVEVKHAYWKETTHITESKRGREIHSKLYNCSNCDAPNGRKKSSYCHWCGAKMDGERKK